MEDSGTARSGSVVDVTDNPMGSPTVDFLKYIVGLLVEDKDAVRIYRTVDEMGVLLSLYVAPQDRGKIIGKRGGVAKAIRTLLRTVGMNNHERVHLVILEDHEKEDGLPKRYLNGGRASEEGSADSGVDAVDLGGVIEDLK